jgi:hypothetical protein
MHFLHSLKDTGSQELAPLFYVNAKNAKDL